MTTRHVPVLRDETIALLEPGPGKKIVDGTYGFGGHSTVCLDEGAEVLGLDLDQEAVAACQQASARRPRLYCRQASFTRLDEMLAEQGWPAVDGLLLDLGVSSRQLDEPTKGFSYQREGPLDLRFDQESGEPAHALLARLDEAELADLLWRFGEERASRRLARAIVRARDVEPIRTTGQLREVIKKALPSGARPLAALSRCFQALRIKVNRELDALAETLALVQDCLAPGGRVVVISYHSLEDRLVKRWLDRESRDCICPPEFPDCRCQHQRWLRSLTRKAVRPTPREAERNPRARSARLRAAEILDLAERSPQ
ncbi:MAG: 16S rRNA (cytosine(1402)-N(4))-methyltransferase RsmH [bacterium]